MSKDGSVAPRERINIQYKSEKGGPTESVELPFKVLVAGDFTLHEDERLIEERKPINVDKDNFNEVLRNQNVKLDVSVADRLTGVEDAERNISLEFRSMKDFEPDQIARQVPELNELLKLREALVALKGPLGNVPAFRKRIEQALQDDELKQQILQERSEEHTSELQSRENLVCRLLLEKK